MQHGSLLHANKRVVWRKKGFCQYVLGSLALAEKKACQPKGFFLLQLLVTDLLARRGLCVSPSEVDLTSFSSFLEEQERLSWLRHSC
jgi:hypothetical protein